MYPWYSSFFSVKVQQSETDSPGNWQGSSWALGSAWFSASSKKDICPSISREDVCSVDLPENLQVRKAAFSYRRRFSFSSSVRRFSNAEICVPSTMETCSFSYSDCIQHSIKVAEKPVFTNFSATLKDIF